MATVLLVRHGRTEWNATHRLQGWAPVQLDERGRTQARHVAEYLQTTASFDIDRIVHSDLVRTEETTNIITSVLDVPTTAESAFRERDIGVYQGLTYSTVEERFPAFALGESGANGADRTPESGESYRALQERVLAGWETLVSNLDPDECVVVVTHGGPIKAVLGHCRDQSLTTALLDGSPRNCSISEIAVESPPQIVQTDVRPWE